MAIIILLTAKCVGNRDDFHSITDQYTLSLPDRFITLHQEQNKDACNSLWLSQINCIIWGFWIIKDLFMWVVLFFTDALTFPVNWICCQHWAVSKALRGNHCCSAESFSITLTSTGGTQAVSVCVCVPSRVWFWNANLSVGVLALYGARQLCGILSHCSTWSACSSGELWQTCTVLTMDQALDQGKGAKY